MPGISGIILMVSGFRIRPFQNVAGGIVRFIKAVLSDPDGGFYASQDADVTPDDEGGYFTWTDGEVMEVLSDDGYRVLDSIS